MGIGPHSATIVGLFAVGILFMLLGITDYTVTLKGPTIQAMPGIDIGSKPVEKMQDILVIFRADTQWQGTPINPEYTLEVLIDFSFNSNSTYEFYVLLPYEVISGDIFARTSEGKASMSYRSFEDNGRTASVVTANYATARLDGHATLSMPLHVKGLVPSTSNGKYIVTLPLFGDPLRPSDWVMDDLRSFGETEIFNNITVVASVYLPRNAIPSTETYPLPDGANIVSGPAMLSWKLERVSPYTPGNTIVVVYTVPEELQAAETLRFNSTIYIAIGAALWSAGVVDAAHLLRDRGNLRHIRRFFRAKGAPT